MALVRLTPPTCCQSPGLLIVVLIARCIRATGSEPFEVSTTIDGVKQVVVEHPDTGEVIWADETGVSVSSRLYTTSTNEFNLHTIELAGDGIGDKVIFLLAALFRITSAYMCTHRTSHCVDQ